MLLVVEGLARLAAPMLPEWRRADNDAVMLTGHPTRLWAMAPGTRENAGELAFINPRRLRGPEPQLPRPQGRRRLMLLGDSSFFGHGVADQRDMGSVAVAQLPDTDLVNGATPGYSIAQGTVFMEEEGFSLEPTVLAIGHLWSDNTWDAFHDEDLLASAAFAARNPLAHSAALRLLASALGGADQGRIITVSKLEPFPEGRVRRVPLPRYATLLDELVREAADRDVAALFIKPANRQSLTERGHWQPYYDAMDAVAAHHGLQVVDMNAAFRDSEESLDALFLDKMHPTVLGHRLVGEALALAVPAAQPGTGGVFDASDLQDLMPPDVLPNMRSPQTALFEEQQGAESQGDGAAWRVTGTVSSTELPIRVSLVVDGTTMSSTTLPAAGDFVLSLRVPVDEAVLRVEAGEHVQERIVGANSGLVAVELP